MKKLVIGVAGGTGSGKTTVVRKIAEQLPRDKFVILQQDSYYKDGSHMSLEDRKKINYDHPLAFDNDLLIEQIQSLLEGRSIEVPIYSFITYTRKPDSVLVQPTNIMIVEGILILEDARIRDLLDIKVFVDTDADERFIRRLKRDLVERGRNVEEVINQYTTVVRPMHNQFVEPTKRYADIIVPEGGSNAVAIDILTSKIKSILAGI